MFGGKTPRERDYIAAVALLFKDVETVDQRDTLVRLGCHRAQGYLLARPEPTERFATRLR